MTLKEAKEITGGVGYTTKTGASFGLPAIFACKTGAKLAEQDGTVCSGCYGCSGKYGIPSVRACQMRRHAGVVKMHDPRDTELWIKAMVVCIKAKSTSRSKRVNPENNGFFRWHDTGDLISVQHLEAIVTIALRLPELKFWLPTKEYKYVKSFIDAGGKFPANLCVRLSSYKIDEETEFPGVNLPRANVHKDRKALGHQCPAVEAHSGCAAIGCHKCWDKRTKRVSYRHHR